MHFVWKQKTDKKPPKNVKRSYRKFLTSSNTETKAWRWNETKRILFLADEVMALQRQTILYENTEYLKS